MSTLGGLQSHAHPKGHVVGTHRACAPTETLERCQTLARRLGITRLANITGLDSIGLPVFVAVRPNSRSLATAQGKGLDPISAKVSALMESIELWHAENIDCLLRHDSYLRLRESVPALDPAELSASAPRDRPLIWIEGFDLVARSPLWVPFDCVTMNCVVASGQTHSFAPSSNGLASGNHLLEAIVHGLCEVIERDALTIWQLSDDAKVKACQIDLSTIADPGCRELLGKLAAAEVRIGVWDMTSDTGVPAYAAEIYDASERPDFRRLGAFGGYGCHLAPEIALLRAIGEAAQSRLTFISGSRDDLFYAKYLVASADIAARVASIEQPAARANFAAQSSLSSASFDEDLELLLKRVQSVGLTRVVAVDLSKPEVGIPVVKVIVPGMEARLSARHYQPGARATRWAAEGSGGNA